MSLPDFAPETASVIKAWVVQLADPVIQHALAQGGQVEVRLFTNGGKVRKTPVVLLNSGPSTLE